MNARFSLGLWLLAACLVSGFASADDPPTPLTPAAPAAAAAAASSGRDAAAAPVPVARRSATAGAQTRAKAPAAGAAHDRLELDPTAITGNRELPKVMVIVPWKKSDIGDLAGKPPNSLVDEILQPVDRDEFRREIRYHAVLSPDRPRGETPVTSAGPPARSER